MSAGALAGRVAVVAGATRGAGRGIAVELGALGATVYAVDPSAPRRELALSLGAKAALDPGAAGTRVDKELRGLTGEGVDVAFEAVGKAATLEAALGSLRRGGRLCVIGFSVETPTWPAAKVMFHEPPRWSAMLMLLTTTLAVWMFLI